LDDFGRICHFLTNFSDHLMVKLSLPEFERSVQFAIRL
jgi:hypothetical protein